MPRAGCPIGSQAAPPNKHRVDVRLLLCGAGCPTSPQATPPNKNKFNVRCLCSLVNRADSPIGPQAAPLGNNKVNSCFFGVNVRLFLFRVCAAGCPNNPQGTPPNKSRVNVKCFCSLVKGAGCPTGPPAAPLENNKVDSSHMFFVPLRSALVFQLVPKPPA